MQNTEALKEQIAALKAQLKEARQTKEFSSFFADETEAPMRWKNLSETKRYFEKNMPEVLAQEVEKLRRGLSSSDFHEMLASKF